MINAPIPLDMDRCTAIALSHAGHPHEALDALRKSLLARIDLAFDHLLVIPYAQRYADTIGQARAAGFMWRTRRNCEDTALRILRGQP